VKSPCVSKDDILDVVELTEKLEHAMFEILKGNERKIAMSAFINASSTMLIAQCDSTDEMLKYKHILNLIVDKSITINESDLY
jgi:hypothetical protein